MTVFLIRISCIGEMDYEIYCKPHYLLHLAESIEQHGAALGFIWYGARAFISLKLEKGWGAWGWIIAPTLPLPRRGSIALSTGPKSSLERPQQRKWASISCRRVSAIGACSIFMCILLAALLGMRARAASNPGPNQFDDPEFDSGQFHSIGFQAEQSFEPFFCPTWRTSRRTQGQARIFARMLS